MFLCGKKIKVISLTLDRGKIQISFPQEGTKTTHYFLNSSQLLFALTMDNYMTFPLFTYELNGDDTQYRCLLKPAVYDPVMSLGFCNYEHTEFQGLIDHLCQDHNYDLTKYINYCCDILFESRLDDIQHYLSHILNLEDTASPMEPYDSDDLKFWLNGFFDKIKEHHVKITNKLLFDEEVADILNEEELPSLE